VFNPNFSLDAHAVATALSNDGVYAIENALAPKSIANIVRDVEENRAGFNLNHATGVYYFHQFYLCHMLAVSRTFTELVTHPKVFEITERIIGPEYRLKALRYYETFGHHHMQWHTDNKTDRGFAQIPGIIFIVYISDVEDGEFQYVRGSHKWSGEKAYNDYSDAFVEENFAKDVLSFKGRAGTLIIYDTYGIHRAKPVEDPDFVRKSLFWQIDREIDQAEPILINPEFLPEMDAGKLRYLGFGLPTEYRIFPQTGVSSLPADRIPMRELIPLIKATVSAGVLPPEGLTWLAAALPTRALAKGVLHRGARAAYRRLPESVKKSVKKALGR
jgi:hypothetical protein